MERELAPMQIPVNMYRAADRLMLAAIMPGLQAEDINIKIYPDRRLVINSAFRGRLKDWKEVLVEEWQAGDSTRSLDLPTSVDGAAGRATYENGVLVIVLPLATEHCPGQIMPIVPGGGM
jgi:HSP20 family protein